MKMKKGLLTMLALLSMGSSAFAQGTVNVPLVKRTAGQVNEVSVVASRQGKVKIELQNNANYRDLQFDLTLPAGVTVTSAGGVVQDAAEKYTVAFNTVDATKNKVRFVVYNNGQDQEELVKFTNGIIVEIPVDVAETYTGSNPGTLSTVITSNDAAESISLDKDEPFEFTVRALLLGNVNDDAYVDATDAVAIALHDLKATPAIFVEEVGDVVEDGLVDSTDAVRIALDDLAKTPSSSKVYVEEENETEVEPE